MRPTCTFCARKHLAQAAVLLSEAEQGYPEHLWYALGHLAEASDELVTEFPALANEVRDHRKALEQSKAQGVPYVIPFTELMRKCDGAGLKAPERAVRSVRVPSAPTAAALEWQRSPEDEVYHQRMIENGPKIAQVAAEPVRVFRSAEEAKRGGEAPMMLRVDWTKFYGRAWWEHLHAIEARQGGEKIIDASKPAMMRPRPIERSDQIVYDVHRLTQAYESLLPVLLTLRTKEVGDSRIFVRIVLDQEAALWLSTRGGCVVLPASVTALGPEHMQVGSLEIWRSDIIWSVPLYEGVERTPERRAHVDAIVDRLNAVVTRLDAEGMVAPLYGVRTKQPLPALVEAAKNPPAPRQPAIKDGRVSPEAAAAGATSGKCSPCDDARDLRASMARWMEENKAKKTATGDLFHRVVVIVPLTNFSPSYSLVSVVLDQVRALALMAGRRVHLWVTAGCDRSQLPVLPDNVEVHGVIPAGLHWKSDEVHPGDDRKLQLALTSALNATGGAAVICHDLIFQAAYLVAAKALHAIAATTAVHAGFSFHHVIHSSVGSRPAPEIAKLRATLPDGHTILAVNHADVPFLRAYYHGVDGQPLAEDRVRTVLNPRDVRVFLGMTPEAATLVSKHGLHNVEALQVYPLSAPRMQAKGVVRVIELMKALANQLNDGSDNATDEHFVRLVIADAHANGKEGQNQRQLMRDFARSIHLPDECLVFTSESLGEQFPHVVQQGLDAASIRSLMQLANVFAFPTTSEAGSLVLMEAAMAGNLLVLNESLPALGDYVDRQDAIWVPWGSVKESGQAVDPHDVAGKVIHALRTSPAHRAKQAMVRRSSIEAAMTALHDALSWIDVGTADPIPAPA